MFRGDKVTLRAFNQADRDRTYDWVNNLDIATLLERVLPVSDFEHFQWYEDILSNEHAIIFAIEANYTGLHIGNVWLWNINHRHRTAELRIVIGPRDHVGKGFGTEAVEMLVDYAFRRVNLQKVYVYVLGRNKRAARAFEKAGFVEEGVLSREVYVDGQYEDMIRMAVLRPLEAEERPT